MCVCTELGRDVWIKLEVFGWQIKCTKKYKSKENNMIWVDQFSEKLQS